MRALGIDHGTKQMGIAISEELGMIALEVADIEEPAKAAMSLFMQSITGSLDP